MTKRKGAEYEFHIDAFSPKTIPMTRLGEYMAQLGRLLGCNENVHFRRLKGGSTKIRYQVESEAVPKVEDRLASIRNADAANDTIYVRNEINNMLRADAAVANIKLISGGRPQAVKLEFAGREIQKPQKIGPFSAFATLKGELTRLEGKDATIHAGIKDSQGRNWSGYMGRELAMQIRGHLFELVKVSGDARWLRNEEGEWELKNFHIKSCDPLATDSLEDDITSLRSIPGNQWKEVEDPNAFISESRNEDDEIH